jgi:hypothetical protein
MVQSYLKHGPTQVSFLPKVQYMKLMPQFPGVWRSLQLLV